MRLAEYLDSTGESQSAFAARAGVSQQTISKIVLGAGTTVDTAFRIVTASKGEVGYEDLVSEVELPHAS